ncbi:MAG: type II secretion system F family protein [Armatimonadetes bacterium]|nr:type II secretion system F family protein [Armatimonadota bacterium]
MPTYYYKAVDKEQQIIKGKIEADSLNSARIDIQKTDMTILGLSLKKTEFKIDLSGFLPLDPSILSIFSRQLAIMLKAGITIDKALAAILTFEKNKKFALILKKLFNEIHKGKKVSLVFSSCPEVFSPFYINMLEIGQLSGNLPQIFEQLAEHQEKEYKILKGIQSALTYPVFIIFASIIAVIILMCTFVPALTNVYKGMNITLPIYTRSLIFLAKFLINYWWVILIGIIAGILVFLNYYKNTPAGRYKIDKLIFDIPLVGAAYRKVLVVRFSMALAILYKNGISFIKSLDVIEKIFENEFFKENFRNLAENVKKGLKLSESFKLQKIFPQFVIEMVRTGEETGQLDKFCSKLANYYETEIDYVLATINSYIEPIIILFLAVVVGYIMLSVLMPLYTLLQSIT